MAVYLWMPTKVIINGPLNKARYSAKLRGRKIINPAVHRVYLFY